MSTFEMLKKSIEVKIKRNALTHTFIASTKEKLDVFLMADRITIDEFNELSAMLDSKD